MQSHRRFLLTSLIAALLASLLFLPGLPGDFVLDDHINIIGNSGIELQSLTPSSLLDVLFGVQFGGRTRVLPTLTFALDFYRGGGLDPATFKTTNIIIHALTTFVLAGFFRRLLLTAGTRPSRAGWAAIALALVWAAHPLQVSSVLYVVQRMQTLVTLFIVLALWCYIKARCAQVEGRSGRTWLLLTGLLWAAALGCKEDAVLLPAYTLALELTVLRFRAANPVLAHVLQRGYLYATVLGAAIFLFLVVPYYWSWETIYNRNFSTYERLLTQGRVLCLYLWQMLVPMPSNMPFYYDWLQPSHGLLQPWTTLAALVLLAMLLGTAWLLRHRRPLFALGVFLFIAGHFITSNVVNLELAFEHRNHLPLIGIALAIGDVLALLASRTHARTPVVVAVFLLSLGGLASATLIRAASWNSDLHLAETSTRIAPNSTRAWNQLCVAYFNLGGGDRKENPYLDQAIAACDKGAVVGTDSIKTLTNIVAMKAIQGTLTEADWARYLARLRTVTMTPENGSSIWVILNQARNGKPMNANHLLEAIEIVSQRRQVKPIESAAMGYFILGHTPQPDKAYAYFSRALHDAKDPAFITGIIDELRKEGQPEWADKLTAEVRVSGRDDVPLGTDGDPMP